MRVVREIYIELEPGDEFPVGRLNLPLRSSEIHAADKIVVRGYIEQVVKDRSAGI